MSAATGADIEALCSKCGDVWHVVVAKVGDEIVRVLCKECGAQHRYKHPNKVPTPRRSASSTSAPRPSREQRVVQRFDTPAVAADLSKAVRTYRPTEKFVVGERVEHPTFGQGVVESLELGKMTVFFAVGRKVLVAGKDPAGGLARPKPFEHRAAGTPPDAVKAVESSDE
jgi:predicted  nucleic acid-binding Zn-ribbon protein